MRLNHNVGAPRAESVVIPHPAKAGRFFGGYLVKPEQMPAPGMLVLHEAQGLNDNIRGIADRFAGAGYVALAADLFSDGNRMVCMFRAFSGLLLTPLNNSTVQNVRAAFEYLQAVSGVDGKRVGAMGFCLGGSFALQLACLDGSVRAISIVSAQNPRPLDAVQRACPIVGSYADPDFTTNDRKKLDLVLDEYKIPHDIKFYPGAKHSMFNNAAADYDPIVADDAWKRTLAFFDQYLISKKEVAA